ncbi:MAG: TRAP transporter small permease [Thermodesulfobacteriota bacterium]
MWRTFKTICSRIDTLFDHSGTVLIVIGGAGVTLTVVLQVVLRYIFKAPLFGLEEFSRLIAVWVYFIGAIFGTKQDSHVQGDVAERLFGTARARSVIKTITWCLSLLLCILFLYHSTKYSLWLYETGERTTGLWWPRITSVGSMFFGALFMTLYSIANLVKYLEEAVTGTEEKRGGIL